MATKSQDYLVLLADREALAWVLGRERMAFRARSAAAAKRMRIGDSLFLYTTRNCFHQPAVDRGRVMAQATVVGDLWRYDRPLRLIGREFTHAIDLELSLLAPYRQGVEIASLVDVLEAFPSSTHWGAYLRRPLFALPKSDARRLKKDLALVARPKGETLEQYLQYSPT